MAIERSIEPIVIPAKAGISWRRSVTSCPETPAFGVPTKYYFVGCPFAGATGKSPS
jgi:hypothetical protein